MSARTLGHDHPDAVVRTAVWLGIVGILLGMLGVALSVVPMCGDPRETVAPDTTPALRLR